MTMVRARRKGDIVHVDGTQRLWEQNATVTHVAFTVSVKES